ncbi:MAG: DUF2059 domain-containing protein [Granulosicoccus sp.]
MPRIRNISIAVIVLLIPAMPAFADETSSREAAVELMQVTKVESMMDQMFAQMPQMINNMFSQMDLPEEEVAAVQDAVPQLFDFITEKFSWEQLEPEFLIIYTDLYSEQDMREVTAFFKTETGQRFIDTNPEVMTRANEVSQRLMAEIMPELMERMQALVEESQEK